MTTVWARVSPKHKIVHAWHPEIARGLRGRLPSLCGNTWILGVLSEEPIVKNARCR